MKDDTAGLAGKSRQLAKKLSEYDKASLATAVYNESEWKPCAVF